MARRLLPVLALAAMLAAVPAARADGDPASDYLISQRVFLPYDTKIPQADQERLAGIVEAAAKGGFPIRVALIASDYDLGSVTILWRKPQTYATFLGKELVYVHKGPLLTAMPNGLGFYWQGHDPAKAKAVLARISVPPGAGGLARAATVAVRRVARSYGVRVAAPADVAIASGSHRNRNDRIVIVVAVALLLAAGGAARHLLRRRRPG